MQENTNKFLVQVSGDCLDSAEAPMRIQNGNYVVLREISKDVLLSRYLGKTVAFRAAGYALCKVLVSFFEGSYIVFRQFNPRDDINVPWGMVDNIYIVEKVLKGI